MDRDHQFGLGGREQGVESHGSETVHPEKQRGVDGKLVSEPVGSAPQERGAPEYQVVQRAGQPVKSGVDEVAEMVNHPRGGAGGPERGDQSVSDTVVAGSIAGRQDQDGGSPTLHG
jgi:hypothetical protein